MTLTKNVYCYTNHRVYNNIGILKEEKTEIFKIKEKTSSEVLLDFLFKLSLLVVKYCLPLLLPIGLLS